jgi:hypothetical protein
MADSMPASRGLESYSARGLTGTYVARYGPGASLAIPGELVLYRAPGIGLRIDLPEPIHAEWDAEDEDIEEIMKGGDILIFNPSHEQTWISCLTTRRSCRSADGLEALAFSAFGLLFHYPEGAVYEQAHTVTRLPDETIAGEKARCFEVASDPTGQQRENLGVVVGEGLPVVLCYANDGVPLRYGQDQGGTMTYIDALEVTREVRSDAFELPYTFLPSTYDRADD